jgi:hypothetical protein
MKIQAIASVPRDIGLRLHWFCQREALFPLGLMPVEYGGAFWNEALEIALENAIADGFDYALTLDFDTIFDRHQVESLISLARKHPDADVILPWQVKRDSMDRIFGVRREDGTFRRRFDESEFEQELMPVDTGHFGLTLIRLAALDRLPRPMIWAQPGFKGRWNHEPVSEADPKTCVQSDIYFWDQCRAHGLRVFLATQVRVGHLQQVVTWPTKDFEVEHQYTEDFRKFGKPANV